MRSATFELGLICYPLEIKLFVCDEVAIGLLTGTRSEKLKIR